MHGLPSIGQMLDTLRNAGLEDSEALAFCSQELVVECGEKLLTLLRKGAPDDAAECATGVLVGLLRADISEAQEDATAAIRVLASRGTHGDSLREAGAIPLLVRVISDNEHASSVEHASGALAHLMMQRAATTAPGRARGLSQSLK